MSKKQYIEFLECAKGFYNQGLDFLDPERDDFSILSGCILLVVGFEKFIKHILESRNPLMVLEKVTFTDILDAEKSKKCGNKKTVSLSIAYERLSQLFPVLKKEAHHVTAIIEDRNFLVHQAGYYEITKIEGRVRVNITDISELICQACLKECPDKVFGKKMWEKMATYRQAYKEAEVLKLNKRIAFLKRIYQEGNKLPCEEIEFSDDKDEIEYDCPICENMARLEIDLNEVVGSEGVEAVWPFFEAFKCEKCGFTLSDPDEIEDLLGRETSRELLYPE